MAAQAHIQLWGAGTTRTFRPIWVMEELGLDYDLQPIGPRTGETQTTQFTALNPKQKIPYFKDGLVRLSESVAISRYLIERYGRGSSLRVPDDMASRAKEDEWVCYLYGELDETSLYVMRRHGDLKHIYGDAPAAVASAKAYAEKHLAVVDKHLTTTEYVVGDRLSLADVVLVSCLDWAHAYGFDLPNALAAYRSRVTERPAYQRAFSINYQQP